MTSNWLLRLLKLKNGAPNAINQNIIPRIVYDTVKQF